MYGVAPHHFGDNEEVTKFYSHHLLIIPSKRSIDQFRVIVTFLSG